MAETTTIRVTLNNKSLEEGRGLNPVALNEPELVRFYFALGLMAASDLGGQDAAHLTDLNDLEVEITDEDAAAESE